MCYYIKYVQHETFSILWYTIKSLSNMYVHMYKLICMHDERPNGFKQEMHALMALLTIVGDDPLNLT